MAAVTETGPAEPRPLLRVAVPNKGALAEAAAAMLREAGYAQRHDPKELLLLDEANGVEFWLVWIAVDLVGVPLLLMAQLYPSALMYIVYGVFCVVGFVSWLRIERRERALAAPAGAADPVTETVG